MEVAALEVEEERERRAVFKEREEKIERDRAARRAVVEQRLARKEQERQQKHSKWQVERAETVHLLRKEPLFKKLEKDYSAQLHEKELELKEKTLEERRTKFKPLLQ